MTFFFLAVTRGFFEEAASLAEKYLEFTSLIRICEATKDMPRLDRYMDSFSEYNFSSFVFQWHVAEGKQGKLLAEMSGARRADLGRFLEGQGHKGISWLHDLNVGQLGKAAETLKALAEEENEIVSRKKVSIRLNSCLLICFVKRNSLSRRRKGDSRFDSRSVLVFIFLFFSFYFSPDHAKLGQAVRLGLR